MVAKLLEEAADKIAEAAAYAERHADYIVHRDRLTEELKKLPTGDTLVAGERTKVTDALTKAKLEAEGRKYSAATKTLEGGEALSDAALLKKKMHAKTVPTPEELKKLAGRKPDGLKLFDEVVKNLPSDTPRKVLKEALEVRFDIKFEMFTKNAKADKNDNSHRSDMNKTGRSMKKLYELMIVCPDAQTKDNPNMKLIKRYGGESSNLTNFYNGGSGLISLSCGRMKDTKEDTLGDPTHLPGLKEECKPLKNSNLFDSTAYHEVAHAVDEKMGFMRKNGSKVAYGGWEDYGPNIMPVAEAVHNAYGYDLNYIQKYLAGEPGLAPVPAPSGADPADWENRRAYIVWWCDSIRVDKSIWWNGATCTKLAIGTPKRVYQEAYSNRWVSYSLDARLEGISGYQFRAPGEWFAEIYSAYFCGVLKTKNPAVDWLKDFKRPTV